MTTEQLSEQEVTEPAQDPLHERGVEQMLVGALTRIVTRSATGRETCYACGECL